jgi:predicted nuclease with RNAse H fold
VITLGVDLAAEPKGTGAVRVSWRDGRALVTDAWCPADDDTIVAAAEGADKIGIDCPLGWPDAFVEFVRQHRDGDVQTPAGTIEQRRQLAYRATDLHVMGEPYRVRPLSVSADRIAHAAFRAAALLARLGESDRSGAARVVEAYPAGSLQRWGLQHRRYKADPGAIADLLAALERRAGLTFAPGTRDACLASADVLDALVVALTARAAQLGLTEPVPEALRDKARREGWISLPDPALEALRDQASRAGPVPAEGATTPIPASRRRR